MGEALENKADKALREYLEAVENHDQVIDKYFPVRPVVSGVPITFGETITEATFKELEDAENRVSEALKKWNRLLGL